MNAKELKIVAKRRKIEEAQASFKLFRNIMKLIINMDKLEHNIEEDYINDWFTLYKESKYVDVLDWAVEFQFKEDEVTKDTHDFWLDRRGFTIAMILRSSGENSVLTTNLI